MRQIRFPFNEGVFLGRKFYASLVFLGLTLVMACGQILNLPPRPAHAPTGSEFVALITPMPAPGVSTEREDTIYAQIISGNVPEFLRTLVPITTNKVINGINHTTTFYVTPDYMAVGTDTNYFLMPMTPLLAQRLADSLGCSLPTRKMVDCIWTNAAVKLAPAPIPPSAEMITVPVFDQHNSMVRTQRLAQIAAHPLGALVSGDKKDVIISTLIYNNLMTPPKPVVIYGWHYLDGTHIQNAYNGHEQTYADYSHGIRFVQMNLTVDGVSKMLTNVLTDPNLAGLLSDDTFFANNTIPVPRYTIPSYGPPITVQPFSQTVNLGTTVNFSVAATGTPLTYQWKVDGTNIAGATTKDLSVVNIQTTNVGSYTVTINNGSASTTSIPALLRIAETHFSILFHDDFETNSSAKWNLFWGSGNGVADYTVNWNFDYGTNTYTFNGQIFKIPPAPNSTNGTTRGVKFTVNNNDASGWIAGVNIYPKNQTFGGNFVLKCDLWLNYPGAAGGTGTGVSGSTEHAIFGINHLGTKANWAATNATSTDGIWFGVDGEGGTSTDYRAYLGNPVGNQITVSTGLPSSDNVSGIYPALFPATRFETVGSPGKNWVAVEIIQTNQNVIWKLDGTIIAQRTNTSSFTNGNIMIGLMDTFSSIAAPAKDSFVIFDNVRVESLSDVQFGETLRLPDGRIQFSLSGVPSENYQIETSTNLLDWNFLTVLPGSNAASIFMEPNDGFHRFYRAQRIPVD